TDRMIIPRRKEGFSAIEALIATVVLAVMLLSLISVFIYGFGVITWARQIAVATQIVQEEMEAVRALAFDSISGLGTTFTNAKLASLQDGAGVLTVEAGPGNDIKKVTVAVHWTYRGISRSKKIVTYVTRKGIDKR
ncbi:MAG: prepilin-type N-terminal cleavage/methylation domain-containing protein, partial [Acidobacteriota bacterium]|nr:prepilin-type N-terminal cleavage/methylation domain-containing protein [Acidobacteriota bacterium]